VEKLPLRSGGTFITCDARVDNREELASRLTLGRGLTEVTDAELILEAYEKWGEDCAQYLIGDFVFAIWDDRKQRLFAARDALGVKHFYYYHQPGRLFAMASEPKALFQVKGIDRQLDELALGDYLVLNSEDKERTFFKNIKRLPATHALCVNAEGMRTWRYWSPSSQELKLRSDGEYHEAFREKLDAAVKSRLRSSDPVGAFLSGGLDSSAIVCIASKHLSSEHRPPLKTFSAVFPSVAELDKRIDERSYIASVMNATNCDAQLVETDKGDPLSFMDTVFWHAESPGGATSAYMDCMIFRAAQESGVRVMLSGIDGDSTVGYGYDDFQQMAERHMYWRLFRDSVGLSRNMPARKHSFKRSFWNRGVKRAVPAGMLGLWRRALGRVANDQAAYAIRHPLHYEAVKPSVRERLNVSDRFDQLFARSFPMHESPCELHFRGLTSGHFSSVLELLEKVSAAFGIEVRYPFFDRRLVEFCIALPPGQRTYRGWTRSIFRHAMKGILPEDVRWRVDKSNIGANVKVNLLKHGRARLDEAIRLNTAPLEPYVEFDVLRKALDDYARSPLNRDREAEACWLCIIFGYKNFEMSLWRQGELKSNRLRTC
jgi:asparagine synthase (glutamine-hydrolysing)